MERGRDWGRRERGDVNIWREGREFEEIRE